LSANPDPALELFDRLHGEWQGVTSTWFEPGSPAVENETRARAYPGYQRNFLHFDYDSSLEEQPFKGSFLFAWETALHQFQAAWVDAFHMATGIMFCTGAAIGDETRFGFSVLGSYPDQAGGEPWGWRTEVVLETSDRLRVTAYNITPAGEEAKAVETIFRRTD
jgi:hypothetical protein